MDMLALILSLANVGANAEVLVLDMLGGLLTASVAERLGGTAVFLMFILM
jgi:tRNA (adenine-N(1)-)-methyltransferase non-catalytic subunit